MITRNYALIASALAACNAPLFAQFGGWGAEQVSAGNGNSRYIGSGDFDGDGHDDVAWTSLSGNYFLNIKWGLGSTVLNGANQSIALPGGLPVVGDWLRVEVGDFNGDGIDDLALPVRNDRVLPGYRAGLLVCMGSATRSLSFQELEYVPLPSASAPRAVCSTDIDGDGDRDLLLVAVVSNNPLRFDIYAYFNDGSGNFAAPVSIAQYSGDLIHLEAGDFDGDGRAELVSRTFSGEPQLNIFGDPDGDGQWSVQQVLTGFGSSAGAIHVEDFDLDGSKDIVFRENNLRIWLNDGSGGFGAVVTQASPIGAGTGSGITSDTADFDGDGDIDLIVPHALSGQWRTILNESTPGVPSFTLGPILSSISGSPVRFITTLDIDSNGAPDVVYALNDSVLGSDLPYAINQTDVLAPGNFDLVLPLDASTDLPLPEDLTGWGQSASLRWSKASGFTVEYQVEVALDANFDQVVLTESMLNSRELPLPSGLFQYGTEYFWRVTASNQAGSTPASSGAFSFSTAPPPVVTCIGDIADDFGTLLLEGDGQVSFGDFLALLGLIGPCP